MAVIENHNGDSLENVYSAARDTYYNIGGYPTMMFDGVLSVEGGFNNQSMYSYYVPKVNERNGILSDFTMDIELENTGLDYTATITMENVGGNTSSNLVLQLTITESHLPISWGMGEEVNSVNRLMVPSQNGTALDFTGGNVQTVVLDFTVAGYWDTDNCEVVAFIQDNSTKEIQQGTKKTMASALFNIDAQAKSVIYPSGTFCGASVEPIVLIKNMGADNLISLDIEYSINGGTAQNYNWTGDLGFNLGEEVTLGEMGFNVQAVNTFEFTVSNPNGQTDPNPDNDTMETEFEASLQITNSTVNFELKTDQYPEETSWELTNSIGEVLYFGDNYNGQPNTVFTETWELNDLDCYTFTIFDVYGDGICCSYGEGYYKLMDENYVVFAEGGEFSSEDTRLFERAEGGVLTANFMADVTSIEEGDVVSFTDLSMGGGITSWSWEFEGGDPATSDEQNPEVTYPSEGVYDVTLTVSDGTNSNTITKNDYIEVDHVTGISNNSKTGISLFPNPATDEIIIRNVNGANVKIYNIDGQLMIAHENISGAYKIDITNLGNGIYVVEILDDGETVVKKISVVK